MEIPEYIRFDFLLVVLGALAFYFSITLVSADGLARTLLLFSGAILFTVGINYIKYNYDLDMEIKELEYAKKKKGYIDFFENKDLLTKRSKEQHIKDVKDTIN